MSVQESSVPAADSLPAASWQYIESDAQLVEVLLQCKDAGVIALDTEFTRVDTYYPIIGLIQICNGQDCFLIDPLTINNPGPLAELLADPELLKVLHACPEDMEVFQSYLGVMPAPVFDTQIAAAVLGVGFSISYQTLVEHYLAISLQKDQTRSDWLRRPLSPQQLNYAALDVIHLLEAYKKQLAALAGTPRLQWVEAESRLLGKDLATLTPPEEYYKKIKGLWFMNRRQLRVMQVLCAWREVTARSEDMPRNRVVDQKALISIARGDLNSKQALQTVANMPSRQIRRYGDKLLSLLAEARETPLDECPKPVTKPGASLDKALLKRLGELVQEQGLRLGIAPELLTKRRHLEQLLRSADGQGGYRLPVELRGWREAVIGDVLLRALGEDC